MHSIPVIAGVAAVASAIAVVAYRLWSTPSPKRIDEISLCEAVRKNASNILPSWRFVHRSLLKDLCDSSGYEGAALFAVGSEHLHLVLATADIELNSVVDISHSILCHTCVMHQCLRTSSPVGGYVCSKCSLMSLFCVCYPIMEYNSAKGDKIEIVTAVLLFWNQFPLSIPTPDSFILRQMALGAAEAWTENRYEMMVSLLRDTANKPSSDECINKILYAARSLLKADRATLFLVDHVRRILFSPYCMGQQIAVPFGSGIVGAVADSGQLVIVHDAYKDSRFNSSVDLATGYLTASVICAPVKNSDGTIIAVLEAINKYSASSEFNSKDSDVLLDLAASAGIILGNAQLFERLSLLNVVTRSVQDILKLASTKNVTIITLIDTIVSSAVQLFDAEQVLFWFVNWEEKQLCSSCSGQFARLGFGIGIAGSAVVSSCILNISNAYVDPRFDPSFDMSVGFRTRCVMAMRLLDDLGRPMAVIEILNKMHGSSFSTNDSELLESFGREVSVAVCRKARYLYNERALPEGIGPGLCVKSATSGDGDRFLWSLYGEYVDMHEVRLARTLRRLNNSNDSCLTKILKQSPSESESDCVTDNIWTWDYDVLKHRHNSETTFVVVDHIFSFFNIFSEFSISKKCFENFIVALRQTYHDNPYHNWYHAVSVLHGTAMILKVTNLYNMLDSVDVLAILIAALAHDADHPGNDNAFEIASESMLARTYNDRSVLENHHVCVLYNVLSRSENDIFSNLTYNDKRRIRSVIISAILGTDMKHHFTLCSMLEERAKHSRGFQFPLEDDSDRDLLIHFIVHTADLCTQTQPFKIASQWSTLVTDEFIAQSARAKLLQIPGLATEMDIQGQKEMQIRFLKFVELPLWTAAAKLFPELLLNLLQLRYNLNKIVNDYFVYIY